jgi:putative endonuclease
MDWTVYILRCADDTLYTGITNDLPNRLAAHESGKGAKYLRGRTPFTLVYTETHPGKSEALKREMEIKRLNRKEKMKLFQFHHLFPKSL